jgi:hypothetical protein
MIRIQRTPCLLALLAALLAWGCAGPATREDTGLVEIPSLEEPQAGDGYLEQGPTVHLQDAKNERYASPLQALEKRNRELEEARQTIHALENRILALEARNQEIESDRAEMEGELSNTREAMDREARVQKEMAETLARLRIRTVQLEQELFHLMKELLDALPDVPVEKGADE